MTHSTVTLCDVTEAERDYLAAHYTNHLLLPINTCIAMTVITLNKLIICDDFEPLKSLFHPTSVNISSASQIQLISMRIQNLTPVVAVVGEHIILPCHLEPAVDARSMAVEWTRPDLKPKLVLVWRAGQKLNLDDENPSYRGRTTLLTDKLKNGDISLKLFKVKLSDGGKYKCYSSMVVNKTIIQLHAASFTFSP
uniref:Ig-like domain-containing protein n=1 Tax=Anabas testudineus TaxID=64144 RepID=A0A3Q1JSS8_ANATE